MLWQESMKVRFTGKKNYIELIRDLIDPDAKVYRNKGTLEYRVYFEIDDRKLERYISVLADEDNF